MASARAVRGGNVRPLAFNDKEILTTSTLTTGAGKILAPSPARAATATTQHGVIWTLCFQGKRPSRTHLLLRPTLFLAIAGLVYISVIMLVLNKPVSAPPQVERKEVCKDLLATTGSKGRTCDGDGCGV